MGIFAPEDGGGSASNGTEDLELLLWQFWASESGFNLTDFRHFLKQRYGGVNGSDTNETQPTIHPLLTTDSSATSTTGLHFCQFDIRDQYRWWHYRVAGCIALIGALTNILTISVLKRRTMINPTNRLLLGLAVSDLLLVVEFIPYAASTMVGGDRMLLQSREHALYVLVHAHLSHVCHTIAIWLTVTLAVWRWVAVSRPHRAKVFCTMDQARRVLLAVYLTCPILAIPTFLLYTVHEESQSEQGSTVYRVDFSSLALAHNQLLKKINFLVYSALVKLVPCVLITILMPAIIRGMWMAKIRRQRLFDARKPSRTSAAISVTTTTATAVTAPATNIINPGVTNAKISNPTPTNPKTSNPTLTNPKTSNSTSNNNPNANIASYTPSPTIFTNAAATTPPLSKCQSALSKSKRRFSKAGGCGSMISFRSFSFANGTDSRSPHKKHEGATERTTSMLLVVMLLFLLTEAPQGMLTGLSLVYGHDFFSDCYMELGDLMDLLALINSSINFVLYCVMSNQFRENFVAMCSCHRNNNKVPHRPSFKHGNVSTATTTI